MFALISVVVMMCWKRRKLDHQLLGVLSAANHEVTQERAYPTFRFVANLNLNVAQDNENIPLRFTLSPPSISLPFAFIPLAFFIHVFSFYILLSWCR
jgi:hypothetical protein